MPEDGYGWEKLFSERMCRHFREDFGLQCRVARFHNVYGPLGTWTGGREKAPAAICRKVIEAKLSGKHEIEIWGDGKQTRSFMYIDDCTQGHPDDHGKRHPGTSPINLGSERRGHHQPARRHRRRHRRRQAQAQLQPQRPKGVNGRNSDNT
jgi:GDP-D-mannose 3',5'-epimerase